MFFMIRSIGTIKQTYPVVYSELCKFSARNNAYKLQVATLTRAAFRDPDSIPDIPPFPYHNKSGRYWNIFWDTWRNRIHPEAKIITVDGPIACGKEKLAKQLAKEFDFLYLRQPDFDDLLVDHYGVDHRCLDEFVSEDAQTCDIEKFLKNPRGINTLAMQHYMLYLRFTRYMEALRHIFCTGQGVVTVRSPWSDTVFAKSMADNGYISKPGYGSHEDSMEACEHYFLKPHLIIYLDTPVNIVQQNIKKRNIPYEVNSEALTEKYLKSIEDNYKSEYLDKMNEHSLMLIYDWTNGGDMDLVIEDIENLNFDNRHNEDKKLRDWDIMFLQWKVYMHNYTYLQFTILKNLEIIRTDIPELLMSPDDYNEWYNAYWRMPETFYSPGYNPNKDKGLFWKTDEIYFPDYVSPLIEKRKAQKAAEKSK